MSPNHLTRREALLGLAGASALRAAPTTERLHAGKSTVELAIADGSVDLGRPAVVEWIQTAVLAVETFYGHFPVSEARIEVQPVDLPRKRFQWCDLGTRSNAYEDFSR